MKKVATLILTLMMAFALVACGGKKEEPAAVETPATETEVVSEEVEETVVETVAEETTEAVEETTAEEQATDTAAPAASADVADAIKGQETSDTAPAALNQWVETARYATEDKTYHTCYVRVNKVTPQEEDPEYLNSVIEQHNKVSYDFQQINLEDIELPSDVELCVLDYEVYVPENFPAPEYGMVEPNMSFSVSKVGGGGIPSADGTSVYIGMGSMEDLNLEEDPKYFPGNTYSFRGVFTMVKGFEDYVFYYTTYPDGTEETSSDIMYYGYHSPF